MRVACTLKANSVPSEGTAAEAGWNPVTVEATAIATRIETVFSANIDPLSSQYASRLEFDRAGNASGRSGGGAGDGDGLVRGVGAGLGEVARRGWGTDGL